MSLNGSDDEPKISEESSIEDLMSNPSPTRDASEIRPSAMSQIETDIGMTQPDEEKKETAKPKAVPLTSVNNTTIG